MEIFKDIPNYEGHYQVSNLGNVKSFKWGKEKKLRPLLNKYGYLYVDICKYSKKKKIKIHSLVAMTFLNHKPNGTNEIVVDHINNIKTDNRLENLQLITNRENTSKDQRKSSSKFTGVSWKKSRNKWQACITINGKLKYLGLFTCELKAALAYQNALNELTIKNN